MLAVAAENDRQSLTTVAEQRALTKPDRNDTESAGANKLADPPDGNVTLTSDVDLHLHSALDTPANSNSSEQFHLVAEVGLDG